MDAGDAAVIFKPYYFNHCMALQMTGSAANIVLGEVQEDLLPDMDWLQRRLAEAPRIKLVTISNPCNPCGVMLPPALLRRAAELCAAAGAWLVVDNAYEYFAYTGEGHPAHSCVQGTHVINMFSFSKSYGMMGYRVGYLAYPDELRQSLLKAQDTIPICPPVLSQRAALGALRDGRTWVEQQVASLDANRRAIREALEAAVGRCSTCVCAVL